MTVVSSQPEARSDSPALSIVIPTSRGGEPLTRALESCLSQDLRVADLEVIVVANPPSPRIATLVESLCGQWPERRVTFLQSETAGANRARNRGLQRARGAIIYFLDDDCELPGSDHCRRVLEAFEARPEALALGGPYRTVDTAPLVRRFYNGLQNVWLRASRASDGRSLALLGGNAAYRRELFHRIAGFDERLVYGGTETELNHRAVLAGARLEVEPSLGVWHQFDGGWRSVFRRAWKQGAGKAANERQEAVARLRDPRARRHSLREAPRPRILFLGFVAVYRGLVELGRWFGAASGGDSHRIPAAEPTGSASARAGDVENGAGDGSSSPEPEELGSLTAESCGSRSDP